MQAYSSPARAADPHALPDVEAFELTATEVAALDEDLVVEYSRRHEFRLCHMNRRVLERMLDAIVAEQGITGGWFYWFCFPGCLPDSRPEGPFESPQAAITAAQEAQ